MSSYRRFGRPGRRESKYQAIAGECSANAAIGVGKSVANVGIGINNLMAAHGFGKYIAPYEEKGACQGVAMHATDVAIILSPLAGKAAPVGVLTADAEETAVVAGQVGRATRGKPIGPTIDPNTGSQVGRFVADDKGNVMIEPNGGSTVAHPPPSGPDTHTRYPNGSNYQRLNPRGTRAKTRHTATVI